MGADVCWLGHRARSLFAFEGDGPDDLCMCTASSSSRPVLMIGVSLAFGENLTLDVHPSKTGGDWWYGTLISTGKTGMFPKTYVEVVKQGMGGIVLLVNCLLNEFDYS